MVLSKASTLRGGRASPFPLSRLPLGSCLDPVALFLSALSGTFLCLDSVRFN